MANRAARSRPGTRLDTGGALHKAVERIDVIQPRRILIGTEPRPRPTFPTGSDAPSGCRSGMTEMRPVQAGRSPTSKPGLAGGSSLLHRKPAGTKSCPARLLFAFRAKPRYAPHRPRQDNQTRRPSNHYPEQKCLSRAHSGEFRAKTKGGSRHTTQQGTNQPERYWIKKRTKKTVLLTVPKKRPGNARMPCPASARSGDPADPLFGHDSQTTPIR